MPRTSTTIDDIVSVQTTIEPASASPEFMGTLFVQAFGVTSSTSSSLQPNKFQTYQNVNEVRRGTDPFGLELSSTAAAREYFTEGNAPFTVGIWDNDGRPEEVRGTEITFDAGDFPSGLTLSINGVPATISLLDGTLDLTAVTSAVQVIVRTVAGLATALVTSATFSGKNRFFVNVPVVGMAHINSLGPMTGTLADVLGLSGVDVIRGLPAENAADFIDSAVAEGFSFFFVVADNVLPASKREELGRAVTGYDNLFWLANVDDYTARPEPAADNAMYIYNTSAAQYPSAGVAGHFSARSLDLANSSITAKGLTFSTNVLPANLTPTQASTARDNGVNIYTNIRGRNILSEGISSSSTETTVAWVDEVVWLSWFEYTVQTAVFNFINNNPRLPLTPGGTGSVKGVVEQICRVGVSNGGLAPGNISGATLSDIRITTGARGFSGYLNNGYFVFIDPISSLTPNQALNRAMPNIYVWLKSSGAIHFVDINIRFSSVTGG